MLFTKAQKIGSFIQTIYFEGQLNVVIRVVYADQLANKIGIKIHTEHQNHGLQVS